MVRCQHEELTFDASLYSRDAIEQLRALWRRRMGAEHVSAAVFLQIALQMMAAGATLDAQAVMARLAVDETRHAEIAGRLLRSIGAEPACDCPPIPKIGAFLDTGVEERALRNVIYTCCLTESVNVARFVETMDRTTDPCVRGALRQLLADEMQHPAFGFQYLQAWSPWLRGRPEVIDSLNDFLRPAFADAERSMAGVDDPSAAPSDEEMALGLPDPRISARVFYETFEQAIIPGLEQLGLDARRAYERRSMKGWA
jgi:hypothetical protein